VETFFDEINRAYQAHIEAAGKEIHFLVLVAFTITFGFIRTSAHLIRAQVEWWPGNVETKGGTHIHHLVWGILLLLTTGYLGLAIHMGSPWLELTAVAFGVGMGLTLDEFALWLNLEESTGRARVASRSMRSSSRRRCSSFRCSACSSGSTSPKRSCCSWGSAASSSPAARAQCSWFPGRCWGSCSPSFA